MCFGVGERVCAKRGVEGVVCGWSIACEDVTSRTRAGEVGRGQTRKALVGRGKMSGLYSASRGVTDRIHISEPSFCMLHE